MAFRGLLPSDYTTGSGTISLEKIHNPFDGYTIVSIICTRTTAQRGLNHLIMVKTKTSSDVLLFAGQGSSAHLTTQTFIDLDNKPPELKALLDDFLQKCLTAFYAEFDALADDEKKIVGTGAKKDIDKPEALLTPPPLYQGSAVFESVTLYLHQLVDLILYKFQNGIEAVIETAGVCSGMLPAILAASFPSSISSQFIEYAVDGFRLAFWIGLRTSLFCHQASPDDSHQPWALTVRGCSVEKLQDRVDEYNKNSVSPASK